LALNGNSQPQVSGTLANPNQVDLYAVKLHAGDEIVAEVSAPSSGSPQGCSRIFNNSGKQLAFQKNQGSSDTNLTFVRENR
jgi:hypothetical protein